MTCVFCETDGGLILYRDDLLRVVLADEPGYAGLCRVILNQHEREMTDLAQDQRQQLMDMVWRVEQALRQRLAPDKINLASLGNQVPHVHWHVIPRYQDDAHFPDPIWAASRRAARAASLSQAALAEELRRALMETRTV